MSAWSQNDSIELICSKKWQETEDTVSFELSHSDQEVLFDFKPGHPPHILADVHLIDFADRPA